MKKVLSLICALCMTIGVVGCGKEEPAKPATDATVNDVAKDAATDSEPAKP